MFELKTISPNPCGLYLVKKGQTIKKISEYFCIPEHIIIFCNELSTEVHEGDFLILPKKYGKEYKVSAGETLETILRKFDFSREEFIELNGVDYVWVNMTAWLPCNK